MKLAVGWEEDFCKTAGLLAVAAAGQERVHFEVSVGTWSETEMFAGLAVSEAEPVMVAVAPWGFFAGWGTSGPDPEILTVVRVRKTGEH